MTCISSSLTLVYLFAAFVGTGGLTYDWQRIRVLKTELEKKADPALYGLPRVELDHATEQWCTQGGCTFRNVDPDAISLRARMRQFAKSYRRLVRENPERVPLSIVTAWDRTYVDHYPGMGEAPPFLSFVFMNVIIDFVGVLFLVSILHLLTAARTLLFMLVLAAAAFTGCFGLVFTSLYSYQLISHGDEAGINAVLTVPLWLMFWALAISYSWFWWTGVRHAEPEKNRLADKAWKVVSAVIANIMLVLAIFGTPKILTEAWSHLNNIKEIVPNLPFRTPVDSYFYVVSLLSTLPIIAGVVCIATLVTAATFARTLLAPTLVYLRTVLRVPAPLLISITATPAAIVQAIVTCWPDIHRMMGMQ
jgi:hypothetical protein